MICPGDAAGAIRLPPRILFSGENFLLEDLPVLPQQLLHPIERVMGDLSGDLSIMIDLGIITNATKQSICDSRCSA